MVEYFNNILCIEAGWLIDSGIMTEYTYQNLRNRKQIKVLRRGAINTPALVAWQSIPSRFQKDIIENFGNPANISVLDRFMEFVKDDAAASQFFSDYRLENRDILPLDRQREYYNNAIILNAINEVMNNRKAMRKAMQGSLSNLNFESIAETISLIDKSEYPHSLPSNERRLKSRLKQYLKEGYTSLIHRSYGNGFARKVNKSLENLILSIYCMSNKPYAVWVHEDYLRFIAGELDVVDMSTGELLDRYDFFDEQKGMFIMISEATCRNYINNPKNKAIVESLRVERHKYTGNIRPHYHRHAPQYSLSKISLDDRDLPRKLHDGNRVKAYYAYDVASGTLIGASYSLRKDTELFVNCVRDMFLFINQHGFGMPMEVEVEHHLVSNFKDDMMKAGILFPFVRFCAPGNSQEKHAEQLNRQKKYGYEKRYQDGIGRFYARTEANQTGGERVYDADQNKYVIKQRTYSFEQLVADDRASIEAYNKGLHRNQKLYKGKSRLDVLFENINPNLAEINKAVLARYIGKCTHTSIVRNMYCTVQYRKFMLPSPEVLAKLLPGNYNVDAYYIPGDNEIYLYQNSSFITECLPIETFNTSAAETTQVDKQAMEVQATYINSFDKMVKKGKNELGKVKLVENIHEYDDVVPKVIEPVVEETHDYDFDENASKDYYKELAMNNL